MCVSKKLCLQHSGRKMHSEKIVLVGLFFFLCFILFEWILICLFALANCMLRVSLFHLYINMVGYLVKLVRVTIPHNCTVNKINSFHIKEDEFLQYLKQWKYIQPFSISKTITMLKFKFKLYSTRYFRLQHFNPFGHQIGMYIRIHLEHSFTDNICINAYISLQ